MKRTTQFSILLSLGLSAFACGPSSSVEADLNAPTAQEAKVSVSATLDVAGLFDPSIAHRIEVDEILVSVDEARLLGADPRIPVAGHSMLDGATLGEFYGSQNSQLDLPFPDAFMSDADLSVFLRIAASDLLGDAAIVVRGRLYSTPFEGAQYSALTANSSEGQDPDGDPIMDPDDDGDSDGEGQDPDGDPIDDPDMAQSRTQGQDPDGDPIYGDPTKAEADQTAHGLVQQGLSGEGQMHESIPFEFHGSEAFEMVYALNQGRNLDVVISIPASRWLTPESVAKLENEMAKRVGQRSTQRYEENSPRSIQDAVVIDCEAGRALEKMENKLKRHDDYSVSRDHLTDLKVRR